MEVEGTRYTLVVRNKNFSTVRELPHQEIKRIMNALSKENVTEQYFNNKTITIIVKGRKNEVKGNN